ncbi:MAG: sortase [Lachnospiraceae bacterium]|nr:sortase [Lachnospiraceae bacterium]
MKPKNRKKGTLMIAIGLLLLSAALFLTIYNIYDSRRAEEAAKEVLPDLRSYMEEAGGETTTWKEQEGQKEESDKPIFTNPDREMPAFKVNGYRYIGILEVPALDLELPVMEEWDYSRLKIAPCLYTGSVYKDNMVIAGHNYAKHFSPIKNLPVGTEITFTDGENRVFEYEIGWIEVLEGTAVEEMITGDWDMTLFTCTYGGEARYAVRCFKK